MRQLNWRAYDKVICFFRVLIHTIRTPEVRSARAKGLITKHTSDEFNLSVLTYWRQNVLKTIIIKGRGYIRQSVPTPTANSGNCTSNSSLLHFPSESAYTNFWGSILLHSFQVVLPDPLINHFYCYGKYTWAVLIWRHFLRVAIRFEVFFWCAFTDQFCNTKRVGFEVCYVLRVIKFQVTLY
jgi:hypothetical protein